MLVRACSPLLYLESCGAVNLLVAGGGNNFENLRAQESLGCNLWIDGNANTFTGAQFDDTGCIGVLHSNSFQEAYLPPFRAIVCLNGQNARATRFNDVTGGPAVHQQVNYATHGIFLLGQASHGGTDDPSYTTGRFATKEVALPGYPLSDWNRGIYTNSWDPKYNQHPTDGTGDFAPGLVGSTNLVNTGILDNNTCDVNGTQLGAFS
jgi:hypothetical protein